MYEDEHWSLRSLDGGAAGWLVLWLRRHAPDITQLTAAEQASLGPTLARVCAAVRTATASERVHLQVVGERVEHFHVMVLARTAAVADEHRGPGLLLRAAELRADDAERSRALAAIGGALR